MRLRGYDIIDNYYYKKITIIIKVVITIKNIKTIV